MLADQLTSGFSLKQAVGFLHATDYRLPASLAQVSEQLAAGAALVPCLKPYLQPNVYFQLQLTTRYGELAPALASAATLLRLMATQRQRLRQLLAYPLGLLGGMALLLGTLQWAILPQLQSSLAPQTSRELPHWPVVIGLVGGTGLVAGVWALRWWWRQPILKRAAGILRWPLIGRIFQAYYAYYLTANLCQLVQSGLSVRQMLAVLQRLPQGALLQQLATVLAAQLRRGELPVGWLRRQTYIPPQLILLLQKGSTTAQLGRELHAYSDLQYQELVRRSERGLAWVQPILLTLVALLIVGAYLHLLLPLYQNLQGVYV